MRYPEPAAVGMLALIAIAGARYTGESAPSPSTIGITSRGTSALQFPPAAAMPHTFRGALFPLLALQPQEFADHGADCTWSPTIYGTPHRTITYQLVERRPASGSPHFIEV